MWCREVTTLHVDNKKNDNLLVSSWVGHDIRDGHLQRFYLYVLPLTGVVKISDRPDHLANGICYRSRLSVRPFVCFCLFVVSTPSFGANDLWTWYMCMSHDHRSCGMKTQGHVSRQCVCYTNIYCWVFIDGRATAAWDPRKRSNPWLAVGMAAVQREWAWRANVILSRYALDLHRGQSR